MARERDPQADGFETENTGGVLTGFLADEDDFDRRSLWRLGSWGAAAVGAVVVAVLANQSSIGWRRDQFAAADLMRQSQQIQSVARESQSEARRLASAIDTLNGDRDRLYSRVTVLEQGLDTVTGSIVRQNATPNSPAAAPQPAALPSAVSEPPPVAQNSAPQPVVAAPATTAAVTAEKPPAVAAAAEPAPAAVAVGGKEASNKPIATPSTPLMASKSLMSPPDVAAGKLIQSEPPANDITAAPMPEVVGSLSVDDAESAALRPPASRIAVQRTEFGVDLGGANSVGGLRALWRGLLKSKSNAVLAPLRPLIAVKEVRNGSGMQLRLVAGPLGDAAAAAKICAVMVENSRACETTVFDGQRLATKAEEPAPAAAKPILRRRSIPKRAAAVEEKRPDTSTLSSLLGRH